MTGACAQVHLGKRLANGERRQYDLTEEEFHDLSFQFQRFSGAMLANLVNSAVIMAGQDGRTVIRYHDLTRVSWHTTDVKTTEYMAKSTCGIK
jgi:hypothetical protein